MAQLVHANDTKNYILCSFFLKNISRLFLFLPTF